MLNKKTDFDKNETESKTKNPTHSCRETNLVLKLIQESQIKINCDELELAQEKRGHILYHLFCPKEIFFNICFTSMYSLSNTLSECIYFYLSKSITSNTSLLVFKIDENLQFILNKIKFQKIRCCSLSAVAI